MYSDLEVAQKYVNKAKNANERGIGFTMSLRKFKQLINKKKCQYTGIDFVKGDNNLNPSIDRIDSSGIYSDDNVLVCTTRINQCKSNLTSDEIIKMANILKKRK